MLSLSQHDVIALLVDSPPEPAHEILGSMLHVPMVTMHESRELYSTNDTNGKYDTCLGPSGSDIGRAMIDVIDSHRWTDILVIYDRE